MSNTKVEAAGKLADEKVLDDRSAEQAITAASKFTEQIKDEHMFTSSMQVLAAADAKAFIRR